MSCLISRGRLGSVPEKIPTAEIKRLQISIQNGSTVGKTVIILDNHE